MKQLSNKAVLCAGAVNIPLFNNMLLILWTSERKEILLKRYAQFLYIILLNKLRIYLDLLNRYIQFNRTLILKKKSYFLQIQVQGVPCYCICWERFVKLDMVHLPYGI